ncbi:MAG: tetratricopeptide repeat protein, partial [Sphingomonas bacterium]|nr:tetratricopeptide repeat protein [Sphingomonas bacterium]
MGGYIHKPVTWNREAATLWTAGLREAAAKLSLEALDANPDPDADAFIQPGFYAFQLDRFDVATAVLEHGVATFPNHPMILLSLGSAYSRWRKHRQAIPLLERFLALGIIDASAFDALAMSCAGTGDTIRARLFGTLALNEKDALTKPRHGSPKLNLRRKPDNKRKIIAFTLFGSHPRYLRGALQNVIAARDLYPDWTCRFIVDDSVDPTFCAVMAEEGAEIVHDTSGDTDVRHRLCRRFLVADDPEVGHFMIRDCDSVVSPREAAAVAEWLDSGLPFHAMRDWYTHTDPMLAGMWGGIAGMFPDMAGAIASFREATPLNTNWDQFFLRDRVWPAIRDHAMVHDRYFTAHRAQPFPTPTPRGEEHVGQNEFGHDEAGQAAALADFA